MATATVGLVVSGSRRRGLGDLLPRRARPIHFVRTPSPTYSQVESSVTASIIAHLPRRAVVHTRIDDDHRDAITFSVFVAETTDVVMSHGLADKRYFWRLDDATGQRSVNRFGHVLVPGRWLKRKLLRGKGIELSEDRIHVVGWPRLDTLLERQRAWDAADVPLDERRPRVLWAPTHDFKKRGPEQESTSTYPAFEEHLPALREHADVQVSVHPRNRTDDKRPTHDQLVWADYVVSDFGTMVYEAWALGKPVLFPSWILGGRVERYLPRSAEGKIFRERIGVHPATFDELVDVVRAGRPAVGDDVTAFMAGYLDPSTYGCAGKRAAAVLDAIRRDRPLPD